MRIIFAAAMVLAVTAPALAQPQMAPERAACGSLGQQLALSIYDNAQMIGQVEKLRADLAAAQAQVKALQDKYDPKPDKPAQ